MNIFDSNNFDKKITLSNAISNWALVLVGIIGFIFVLRQLNEFKKQNTTLESTFKQSYRPLGVARTSWDDPQLIIVRYPDIKSKSKDKFSFLHEFKFKNLGMGTLFLYGYVSYLSTENIDFRKELLSGTLTKAVQCDTFFQYGRRYPILINEPYTLPVEHPNVPFERQYFSYTMFLYEDQDGNLFDTVHLEVLNFKDPISTPDGLNTEFDDTKSPYMTESYKSYSLEEKQLICNSLKNVDEGYSIDLCREIF